MKYGIKIVRNSIYFNSFWLSSWRSLVVLWRSELFFSIFSFVVSLVSVPASIVFPTLIDLTADGRSPWPGGYTRWVVTRKSVRKESPHSAAPSTQSAT
jgi:hypothetical protein